MKFEDLMPHHVSDVDLKDLENLGLPTDIVSKIWEYGIEFKWDSLKMKYIPYIPNVKD